MRYETARRMLFMAELRQPRWPKPHVMRAHDGWWYLVDATDNWGTWRQREPITRDPRPLGECSRS